MQRPPDVDGLAFCIALCPVADLFSTQISDPAEGGRRNGLKCFFSPFVACAAICRFSPLAGDILASPLLPGAAAAAAAAAAGAAIPGKCGTRWTAFNFQRSNWLNNLTRVLALLVTISRSQHMALHQRSAATHVH